MDSWHDVVDVNLSGVFYSLRAEVEVMLRGGGGSIINMASIYGLVGVPVDIAYRGQAAWSDHRAAALAYARRASGSTVAPAVIETPLLLKSPEELSAQIVATHPSVGSARSTRWPAGRLPRLGPSSFCTGGVYPVDGAFTAA